MSTTAGTWHIQRPASAAANARRAPRPSRRGATRCQTSACVSTTTFVTRAGPLEERRGDESPRLAEVIERWHETAVQDSREAPRALRPATRPRVARHALLDQPLGLRRHRPSLPT